MYFISKRAKYEGVLKRYVSTVWKSDRGFFENLFKIGMYVSPFLGVGWVPLLLSSFGSYLLGVGASDLGRLIDNKLGIGPGESPGEGVVPKLEEIFTNLIKERAKEASLSNRSLTKNAGIISSLIRSGAFAKTMAAGIGKLMMMVLGVFGLASVDEFVREMTSPVRKTVEETVEPVTLIKEPVKEKEPEQKNEVESMIEQLEKKYNL